MMAEKLREQTSAIWLNEGIPKSDRYKSSLDLKIEYLEKLANIKLNCNTIRYILSECGGKNQRRLAGTMFYTHKDEFIKLLRDSIEDIYILEKDLDGDVYIYGNRFKLSKRSVWDYLQDKE